MEDVRKTQREFLDHLESNGKSVNTLKNYRLDLNCFNDFLLSRQGHFSLAQFPSEMAKDYSQYLNTRYNANNSIRRRVQALRLFFDYLVEKKTWSLNPVREMVVVPKDLRMPSPPTPQEIEKIHFFLLEQCALSGLEGVLAHRNLMVFYLVYFGGLKVSDLHELMLEDLFFHPEKDFRVLIRPPSRDPYSVPLPLALGTFHLVYTEILDKQKKNDKINFGNYLFSCNPTKILAQGLSPRGLELIFKEWSSQTGIKITPRNTRQACVLRWMHHETPVGNLKEWLGVSPDYDMKLYEAYFSQYRGECSYSDLLAS